MTEVLPLPLTVPVNCWVCEAERATLVGRTPTEDETTYLMLTGTYMRPGIGIAV